MSALTIKSLEIIGYTKDKRTDTQVVYAQIDITEYLLLVGEDFDRFEIQRKREKHTAYKRMKDDIVRGALLPTITLAINPSVAKDYIELANSKKNNELIKKLSYSPNIYILDGLQRTYIISDIRKEGLKLEKNQKLLLEFWLESEIKHLIYRLIVLNAGQKPMSMRHQVELLFMTMHQKLESEIPGLIIYAEKEVEKRTQPKEFAFNRLVTAYYSFLTKSPEVKRENIVVQQMNEEEVMGSSEGELDKSFRVFTDILKKYCQLDSASYKIYQNNTNTSRSTPVATGQTGAKNWFADENVINSFFAAVASFSQDNENRLSRIYKAIDVLRHDLRNAQEGEDPLFLDDFSKVRSGINPKKVNVGYEVRKILTDGFKEFFREEGFTNLGECWRLSAR